MVAFHCSPKNLLLCGVFLLLLVLPSAAFARVGVGVALSKIEFEEPLRAGAIYEIALFPVINTGSEASEYEVAIEYEHKQPQLLPEKDWFSFEPATFFLEPGEVKQVKVMLTLPVKTEPGDYFAYLEARAIRKGQQAGTTSIGVAAAAKLWFTVTPANLFEGLRWRFLALWERHSPWPQIASVVFGVVITLFVLRLILGRFFALNVRMKGKEVEPARSLDEEEILRLAEELKNKRSPQKRATPKKAAPRKTATRKKPR